MTLKKLLIKTVQIPLTVENDEQIVRGVYHSMNFNKNTLKNNVLRSPANKDEISVIRLDFCDIEFCRNHFASHQGKNRNYWGFFILHVYEVRNVGSDVISTQDFFKEHADIIHNYIEVANEPLPLEIKKKIDQLMIIVNKRIKEDKNIEDLWVGPIA